MRRFALALLPLFSVAGHANALPKRLPPVEQCTGDRGFDQFRNDLKRAVTRKDRDALLAMLAPDVIVNFGGGSGRDDFAREWSFDPTEHGNLWELLERMLKLGCAQSDGTRIIPSLIVQLDPYSDEDWLDAVLILPGATLYKEAGVEHAKPSTPPWAIVPVISRVSDTMTGVRLTDGREGYIPDEDVYEPLGYRMVIEKRGGNWMITAFVIGD